MTKIKQSLVQIRGSSHLTHLDQLRLNTMPVPGRSDYSDTGFRIIIPQKTCFVQEEY